MDKHQHQYRPGMQRKRCQICGEYQPMPVFRLRCEWCKLLFDWKPRSPGQIQLQGPRRFCSESCAGRCQTWENDRAQRLQVA